MGGVGGGGGGGDCPFHAFNMFNTISQHWMVSMSAGHSIILVMNYN